jgi:hypothetical protein
MGREEASSGSRGVDDEWKRAAHKDNLAPACLNRLQKDQFVVPAVSLFRDDGSKTGSSHSLRMIRDE